MHNLAINLFCLKFINVFNEYKTYSYDETHLSPWITWPTVHRGATFIKHKIENLGLGVGGGGRDPPREFLLPSEGSNGLFILIF